MGAEAIREESGAKIRLLRLEDAPAVTRILREAPEAVFWREGLVEETLNAESTVALGSVLNGEVMGFLIGRQMADEAEILNLGVMPARRRKGEGGLLLEGALGEFRRRGANRVFLEVRESNRNAIAFYKKRGFSETGRREGYYREPEEAAVVMEKKLTQTEERSA
jgi:ribosomal-protein-alanine N-acetyltransferase